MQRSHPLQASTSMTTVPRVTTRVRGHQTGHPRPGHAGDGSVRHRGEAGLEGPVVEGGVLGPVGGERGSRGRGAGTQTDETRSRRRRRRS